MEANLMDFEKFTAYIELANYFFEQEKNRKNLRIGTHIILDFYKLVLSSIGSRIGEKNLETKSIPQKFLLIRMHIRKFEKQEDLIMEIEGVRNKISHNDFWAPDAQKLKNLIGHAKGFLDFTLSCLKDLCEKGKRVRELKDKVEDELFNLKFYIGLNESVGYKSELEEFVSKEKKYNEMDLENLEDKNLQSMLALIEIDISRLKRMYDKAWITCPKCNGKIVQKSYSRTNYAGPYDDPEPDSVTYFEIVECEKCGFKLVDEQETIYI